MKVKIKDVIKSGYNPYEDKVFSYDVIVKLENGRELLVRDDVPWDFREYIRKQLDFLISAAYISKINLITESEEKNNKSPVIRGKYIGEYTIPEKWLQCEGFKGYPRKHAVDYEGNIFLITQRDFRRQGIEVQVGEEIVFMAAGLELKAWLPIEE
ncbi:MAG: hypothetical protein ACTSR8_02475 [Promethearchaeota archaeon]